MARQRVSLERQLQRKCLFETMEPRRMLSANPIVLGTVYIEEDLGSDLHGDRFEITFSGGAAGTQLTRLVINGDQNTPGFSVGDVFFDTESSGLGADHSAPFHVQQLITANPHAGVAAHVVDGGTLLVLDFEGFQAGDKLIFTIDVDEVEYLDPNETDLETINEGFDPVTSGVEFQGSRLTATFTAPHYLDAEGTALFWNRYDEALQRSGLNLPEDNVDGKRDRTTGGFVDLQQQMNPASISGYVYSDDSNDGLRDPGEQGLAGVTVRIIPIDTFEPQEIVTVVTDSHGYYEANHLAPGSYRIVEVVQPAGYLDGLDRAGTVAGIAQGAAVNPGDNIEGIFLTGGTHGIEYNFGEILPASISGSVHLSDSDGNCYGSGVICEPLANVPIQLLDASGHVVGQTVTDSQGNYQFIGLAPGVYRVIEFTPAGLIDAGARAGLVDGQTRGTVLDPNTIVNIEMQPGDQGIDYDFCEHVPSQLSGYVYHDRNDNGLRESGEAAIRGATIRLIDENGNSVATVQTDANGFYEFTGLLAGSYRIVETQPAGWLDGRDSVGRVDGFSSGSVSTNDTFSSVVLRWGSTGANYNFGELLPGSVRGVVYADLDRDCIYDPVEAPIANVKIELLSATGIVLATTYTDSQGEYEFTNLAPGQYGVRETQPAGYFQGGQKAGSHGGDDSVADLITKIPIGSDQHLVHYDFCEVVPGSISGIVYVDPNLNETREANEQVLAGVSVQLLDASGQIVATTQTNQQGHYEFLHLRPGTYGVHELQPQGYFHGGQQAGSNGGVDSVADYITEVVIGAGQNLADYNFSEVPPSSISGIVYVDPNLNETHEANELVLAGVTVQLLDASGQVVATTQTNQLGYYEFLNLRYGTYGVHEWQPIGYYHGGQQAGSHGGVDSVADYITEVAIGAGQNLVDYNFSEVPPSSIQGTVYVSTSGTCSVTPEYPLRGVLIELLDSQGNVVATTRTDAQGNYRFDQLQPGQYALRETQPSGYFQGGQCVGSGGGSELVADLIGEIPIGAGVELVDYDFYEFPPAVLSGYVFQDGATLVTEDGSLPDNVAAWRNGQRTPDDQPIAGVMLELRHGITGLPIMASQALEGYYADGPIVVMTDANGYYEFAGLPAGIYAVYEVHPASYLDGIDTAGTTNGVPFNLHFQNSGTIDPLLGSIIVTLAKDPADDAIVRIPLMAGQTSAENNFSELLVKSAPPPLPPPPPPTPPLFNPYSLVAPPGVPLWATSPDAPRAIPEIPIFGSAGELPMTWHLSVVNGGLPRGGDSDENVIDGVWRTISYLDHTQWTSVATNNGYWTLPKGMLTDIGHPQDGLVFGMPGAIPISGDFNGDGVSEVGLYFEGDWYIDVNGNGRWDEEDLWARLGSKEDLPIVGDWDGDGKDDIGIFGPQWRGDERALAAEPGLPDPQNVFRRAVPQTDNIPKNLPPEPAEATDGRRILKHTADGHPRLDVIDHVFRYGISKDVPVAGDWNGDGIRSIGVFRSGTWYLDLDGDGRHTERDLIVTYGQDKDIPVVGDFNGDGIDEIGIYRDGTWTLDTNGNRELDAHDKAFQMGDGDSVPVVGDWNGDGTDDPAVYREAS